jgi:hypothetical protein
MLDLIGRLGMRYLRESQLSIPLGSLGKFQLIHTRPRRGFKCLQCLAPDADAIQECLHCHRLLAPLDPTRIIRSDSLPANGTSSYLGAAVIDISAGIAVTLRRLEEPRASVVIYTLPRG